MRLLAWTCSLGFLLACGESQGSGAAGGGAGLGGHDNAGGKSGGGEQSVAGSSQAEAGASTDGGSGAGGSGAVAVVSSHKRASTGVLFPDATPVAELGDVCGARGVGGMDVTPDGLRLYIACSDNAGGYLGPLRLATRVDRQSPFVLAPKALGTVGNSISISQDELTLYAVTTPGAMGYTLVYQRASLDDPFGPGELVMGLGGPFRYPEISPDGLNLFGVAGADSGRLVAASRGAPSGSFSSPTNVGLPAPAGGTQFGPTIAQTCHLWYLNFAATGTSTINVLGH